jgi:hypothetical protein
MHGTSGTYMCVYHVGNHTGTRVPWYHGTRVPWYGHTNWYSSTYTCTMVRTRVRTSVRTRVPWCTYVPNGTIGMYVRTIMVPWYQVRTYVLDTCTLYLYTTYLGTYSSTVPRYLASLLLGGLLPGYRLLALVLAWPGQLSGARFCGHRRPLSWQPRLTSSLSPSPCEPPAS